MSPERLSEILLLMRGVRVAVCGDFCLDAYWIMDERGSEISVETGLQAQAVGRHYYSPGGAGNVVANLAALQPAALRVIGVLGDDIHGRELRGQLEALGADTSGLIVQVDEFDTYTYLKRISEGREEPRMDFGVYNRRSEASDRQILSNLRNALERTDVLIFNQQVRGSIVREEFFDEVNSLFADFDDKIILLDSRHCNPRFRGVYRKTNDREIAALCGVDLPSGQSPSVADLKEYGRTVYEAGGKPVLVTCGDRGILSFGETGTHLSPGLHLTAALDTVGAGDTVIAALGLCLGGGIAPAESAEVANLAAAVTVQKLYTTGTASAEEIRAIGRDPDYVYLPDLADDPRQAGYFGDSEIEICDPQVMDKLGHIRFAVFDHDGTISTLRHGWEEVMEPVMVTAILGDRYADAETDDYRRVVERVRGYIDKTTGVQTYYQMEGLAKMVREFGFVPEGHILDAWDYKDIYNEALMERVEERINRLKAGELDAEDFAIKGAVGFLEKLRERGVKLCLASGTDVEDVQREAELLGYAGLFDGGIFGARRDLSKFSKKMIVEGIIREHGLRGPELAVFGDGPVEMRECRKAGGIAVGIAGNEMQRFGLCATKRSRLIRAGAHILAPDFAQGQRLMRLLFGE